MTVGGNEPTAQAHAIMERLLALVRDCRLVLPGLERPSEPGESSSAEAERILYFTLMSAIEAGLIRTVANARQAMKQAKPCQSPLRFSGVARASASLGPFPRLVSGFARVRDGASPRRAARLFTVILGSSPIHGRPFIK